MILPRVRLFRLTRRERRWRASLSSALAAGVALAAGFALAPAHAAPLMDGEIDAEYSLVAASPRDNLLVDPAHGVNDPADPRAKALDVTDLYAASNRTHLYLFIALPYLDLNAIAGEWAVVFHLKGANDGIQRAGAVGDPYGASVDFAHAPALNAVLKSNMRGFLADYDGNQGWAFLNPTNKARDDWAWENSNFLGSAGWTADTANGVIHGRGQTGGEVVYRAGKGIEVKIPLAAFAPNTSATDMTPPKPGDTLLMQFYANVRERAAPLYPRGPIDSVPFEAESRTDPARGTLTAWAQYTLSGLAPLEVRGARLKSVTDSGHIVVAFSDPVGAGAADPSHYTVVRTDTGAAVPVTSAEITPAGGKEVTLGVALPLNTALRVTARGVQGANGAPLSGALDRDVLTVGTPVVFALNDPYGAIASLPKDPETGEALPLTLTGDMTGWRGAPDGSGELPMVLQPGAPARYESPPVLLPPGPARYKYRVPGLTGADAWNALNPHDRYIHIPATADTVRADDDAAGPTRNGGPVRVTFTLEDRDGVAAGRPVYLTGDFLGWSADPGVAVPMPAVAGLSNTYRATLDLPAGHGRGTTTRYRYILKPGPVQTAWDALNPDGDRWVEFGAPVQDVTDIQGGPRRVRIARAAAGLDAAPAWSEYYAGLDNDRDGRVTLRDAVPLPRLKTRGVEIVGPDGAPVVLRGINLGGWLVEEMWMTPWAQDPPQGSPYSRVVDHVTLWSTLNQRLGAGSAGNVRESYRSAWLQPADLRCIKAAGFTHIRLPFLYDLVEEPRGMDWLRRGVDWANAAGLYAVLDMHGAPGSQNGWDHSGQVGATRLFSEPANIAKAVQVWTDVAREFGGNPGVAAFDLMNEPAGAPSTAVLHEVHNQMFQAIRTVAPDTMIIIEDGYKGFSSIPPPTTYGWTNVIYSTHLYDFDATTPDDHVQSLNAQLPGLLSTRASRNVPLYIGEFNLEPHNSPEAMALYTRALTDNGISWALWTYKTVARHGPMGYWGLYRNTSAIGALDPFVDSEATLRTKAAAMRTENLRPVDEILPVFRTSAPSADTVNNAKAGSHEAGNRG